MAISRLAATCSGILAVVLAVGCKVSVPDVNTHLFACKGDGDCITGYGCWHPPSSTNGVGWCTPSANPVQVCADTYCQSGEVCVQDSGVQGGHSCQPACAQDSDCTHLEGYTGCGSVLDLTGRSVGACVSCPHCTNGTQCYKLGAGAHDWTRATYCNKSGETCVSGSSADADGDGARYCEDSDCYFQGHCTCGNFFLDSGEVCDGYLFASTASCPANTSGRLHCTGSCTLDTSECTTSQQQTCNNGVVEGTEQCDGSAFKNATNACSFWSSGTTGTVTCTSACVVDTSSCQGGTGSTCSNAAIDPGEDCDGVNYNGQSCATLSSDYTTGSIACMASTCLFNTVNCQTTQPRCGLCLDAAGTTSLGNDCTNAYCSALTECNPWNVASMTGTPSATQSTPPAIVVGSSRTWIAWVDSTQTQLVAFAYDGFGGTFGPYTVMAGVSVQDVAISLTDNGQPIVAWTGVYASSLRLYARVFDGSSFNPIGTSDSGYGVFTDTSRSVVGRPAFARATSTPIPPLGLAVVLSTGDLAFWRYTTGGGFQQGASITAAGGTGKLALAQSTSGRYLAVWGCSPSQICAAELPTGGSSWSGFGSGFQLTASGNFEAPGAAYTGYNGAVTSWVDLPTQALHVQVRRLGGWTQLLDNASSPYSVSLPSYKTGSATLAIYNDRPVVAWTYSASGFDQIQLRAWEGTARGWRAFNGSACPGVAAFAGSLGLESPALQTGVLQGSRLVCITYLDLNSNGVALNCHNLP